MATSQFTNRLINETSPYLLQHAHNPVDWHAWGPESFAVARSQNKPIFLSVGYSTCYWCHVMERQSFENEAIALEMNARFINIKVDREERPDVDQLYMTAVQILTRHGGWPMSIFLLPDLRPFYGGTYFPPADSSGRPGFLTLLRAIDDAFQNRRNEVEQSAIEITRILQQFAQPAPPTREIRIDEPFLNKLIERSTDDFDPINGGYGSAPKFPRETLLELLLQSQISNRMPQIKKTLDAMAIGGIRDQLGGAFHRYSTDAKWLIPHFEIMLYDNAMLAWIYAEASRRFNQPHYAEVARGILDFAIREMRSPEGAFFTALDAEVDSHEGDPYLWTAAQIEEVLGAEDAKLFNRVYGVDLGPNFSDPHGESSAPDRNVLFLAEQSDDSRLPAMRQKLYEARRKRKQPRMDTKILTSWNALMIRALAHAANVLNEPGYLTIAKQAADVLWDRRAIAAAFLDDHAFFAHALIAVDQKDRAREIVAKMIEKFAAPEGGFYFTAADADDLIVRQMTATDSPLPSGNAVAAMVLMQLGQFEKARRTIEVFSSQLASHPGSMSAMVQTAHAYVLQRGEIVVSAKSQAAVVEDLIERARDVVQISSRWIDRTTLKVALTIADGFHINAHDVADPLIPTRITLSDADIAAIRFPPGSMYENDVKVTIILNTPPSKPMRLSLTYQPCDATACLAPVTKSIDLNPEP